MKCSIRSVFLTAALALLASTAQAQVFVANLTGPNESPPNASPGTGFAVVTLDEAVHTMQVQISFTGLTSGTTASHIHSATAVPGTGTAGVATQTPSFVGFPLGVTSGTFDNTLDLTSLTSYNPAFVTANGGTAATAEAALVGGITSGKAYLNIHTTNFPTGEIRGFLTPAAVPEPGAMSLLGGLALSGTLFAVRLRRRR